MQINESETQFFFLHYLFTLCLWVWARHSTHTRGSERTLVEVGSILPPCGPQVRNSGLVANILPTSH